MAIQNFLPLNTLDKGEFVFCRFDGVGDSPSYPIVQMPFITQSKWQNRVITSIACAEEDIIHPNTNLFNGYLFLQATDLPGYTLTLKTDKNIIILDNMPLNLLSTYLIQSIGGAQRKTSFSVSLDNSFVTRHSDAVPSSTDVVIAFYIQYK
mgnify:CR=1 FL=1